MTESTYGSGGADVPAGRKKREPDVLRVKRFDSANLASSQVPLLPPMSPEESAARGFISADEYLDLYDVPRRAWPPVKESGSYCVLCNHCYSTRKLYRTHMRYMHVEPVRP